MVDFGSTLGATGGAVAGGALGTLIAPGLGTVLGASAGGIAGGILGGGESKKEQLLTGGSTTISPYAYYAPSTSTQTSSSVTNAWQYNPVVSYVVSSPNATVAPVTSKKDEITQKTGQAATPTSNLSAPTSQSSGLNFDVTQIALIAGAALVLYGFVKK